MSIETELTNYITYLGNAYGKCQDKGASMPSNKNLQNLTNCIDSISGGASYTTLEYIQSTGTQFIDTGIDSSDISTSIRFVFKFAYSGQDSNEHTITGNKNSNGQGATILIPPHGNYNNNLVSWCGSGTGQALGTVLTTNKPITIDITFNKTSGRAGYYNSSSFSYNTSNTALLSTENYGLFSDNPSTANNTASIKLYDLKIFKDANLVRNFVPALDGSNTACLYDLVSKNFYYNKGTGTFNYA